MHITALLPSALLALPLAAQFPVASSSKVSQTQGNLGWTLTNQEYWGQDPTAIGDVDGDGVGDLAVGWPLDSTDGANRGGVHVLLRNLDGSVKARVRIGSSGGGFTGALDDGDQFGGAIGALGDVDLDGVPDIAVGATGDDDGGLNHGAVWVLFLNADGTVKRSSKISDTAGGLNAALSDQEWFGRGLRSLGDLTGDGRIELAVGAVGDRDGTGANNAAKGAVFLLTIESLGRVRITRKISLTSGGFTGPLGDSDNFGFDIEPLGDLDGDGVTDIAVAASSTDDGGVARGAVWILRLNADLTVKAQTKISETSGGLMATLEDGAGFGSGLAQLPDSTGNGRVELAVGAAGNEGGAGSVFLLELMADGSVSAEWQISAGSGNAPPDVSGSDFFGGELDAGDDLDGDGMPELLASATGDDDGGANRGAFYTLRLCPLRAATSATRNGTGANPALFSELTPAIVGESWRTYVDLTTIGAAFTAVVASPAGPLPGIATSLGELLIQPPFFPADVVLLGTHVIPLPFDCGLIGMPLWSQAAVLPLSGPLQLTNAVDVVIGGF